MGDVQTDSTQQEAPQRAERLSLIPDRDLVGIIRRFAYEKTGGIIERLVRNVEAARGEANRFEALWKQLHDSQSAGRHAKELLDKRPPANLDAELAVLGSVLFMPTCFPSLRTILEPDDFYCVQNKAIFQRMLALEQKKKPIDTLLLAESLRQSGELEMVGGSVRLAEILEGCPTARNFVYYANLVKAEARKRRLIRVAMWTLKRAHDADDVETIESELKERIAAL